LSLADVVVGLKVAEVDYTLQFQPSFSIENLIQFHHEGMLSMNSVLWNEIDNLPYVTKSNLNFQPYNVFVVSTCPRSYVNVVFGVRKMSEKGHQVVGISCKPPGRHVIQLDIDESEHKHLVSLVQGMEGQLLYHLLPEVSK